MKNVIYLDLILPIACFGLNKQLQLCITDCFCGMKFTMKLPSIHALPGQSQNFNSAPFLTFGGLCRPVHYSFLQISVTDLADIIQILGLIVLDV